MGKIKPLDAEVYRKIAAGEVVERPLSVVKELVENALDAGATEIAVILEAGGKRRIRVEDDGEGFAPEDIEPAFQRHSTSKLARLEDLDRLHTLGFRGEALPSILEVARVSLETADGEGGSGLRVVFEDGRVSAREEIACPRGARIEVRDLFHNFPVRRKFLKSDRTELGRVQDFLEQMALAHFAVSFSLTHNGRELFRFERTDSLRDRVYQVLGREQLDRLQEIDHAPAPCRVSGLISRLNTGVPSKKYQYFFVNGRLVREKTLFAALNRTFEAFLEKHHAPVAVLMVDVPAEDVDVNIHPMKLEIRFRDSGAVFHLVREAIVAAFSGTRDGTGVAPDLPAAPAGAVQRDGFFAPSTEGRARALFAEETAGEDFRLIGQYRDSYILVEREGSLLVIDQHNAHERVNFDRLKRAYRENGVDAISPLFPVVIDLPALERSRLDETRLSLLAGLGFEITPLSGGAVDVKKFPRILDERQLGDVILALLALKKEGEDLEDRVLAEVACKGAVKVNHRLHPEEMRQIVRDLFACENPHFCPHRRPIIVDIGLEEIEKRLKRR